MDSGHTPETLARFEEEIKDHFLAGRIRAPIHLSGSVDGEQERALIRIFKDVQPGDWVFSSHRSHYHALLKGLPVDWVRQEILAGRSIHLMNTEHRFFSSAIVGGCLPIALGVALGLKLRGEPCHVWCCVGDMAERTGLFRECCEYALGFDLPVTFVVEDNGLSVNTPTEVVWGTSIYFREHRYDVIRYPPFQRKYPHINAGQWVEFR